MAPDVPPSALRLRVAAKRDALHADLDVVAHDADFECVDGKTRVVGPFAVLNAEAPGVPWAGNDTLLVEITGTERRAHVGTEVVDCEVVATLMEYCHQSLANLKRAALAFGNGAHFGDGDEIVIR